MHRGYTKRWRKRWDKGYHQDQLLWTMMDYFIDFANWMDSEFPFIWRGALVEMVKIKRGQCFFTFQGLATFLTGPKNKVSRKMVRRRVEILDQIGFLGHQPGRHYQIINVLNYDKYNPPQDVEGRQQEHERDIKGTSKGHQRDTPNNYNKDKKDKKVKDPPYIPPGGLELFRDGFGWINVESWDDFLSHRTEIKKPLTALSTKKALNLLEANQTDQKKIIDNTIMNRWTGLFELKNKKSDSWDALRKEFCE